MESANNINTSNESAYGADAVNLVDRYRQRMNSVLYETELTETEKEALLVEAAQWYETQVSESAFTELQLVWAWFANSSEDEWQDPHALGAVAL